jgi:hypothetical protein
MDDDEPSSRFRGQRAHFFLDRSISGRSVGLDIQVLSDFPQGTSSGFQSPPARQRVGLPVGPRIIRKATNPQEKHSFKLGILSQATRVYTFFREFNE